MSVQIIGSSFKSPLAKELPVNGWEPAVFVTYEGSQVYSPIPYLAYAAAALVARALGLSWLETLYLLRFVGLLVAAAMITYAVAITPVLKWAFFCIAMLPTAVYQRSVISIDGVILGATLVVIALCLTAVIEPGRVLLRGFWITCCSLTKPPQVAFALLEAMHIPLLAWRTQWRSFLLVTVPGAALALVWAIIALLDISAWRAGLRSSFTSLGSVQNIEFLLGHPGTFASAVVITLNKESMQLWKQLIGVFGWLDTAMVPWSYSLISILLIVTFFEKIEMSPVIRMRLALLSLVTALVYCVGVFALFFISEMPSEGAQIFGLQGRYFIVVLPLMAMALSTILSWSIGRTAGLIAVISSFVSMAFISEALWRVHWQ